MSGRLGVELTPTHLRAVMCTSLGARAARTAVVAWDPAAPRDGVRALREALAGAGEPDSIALAVGLGFLSVARASLPPAPAATREAMLALEPARWFASDEPLVVALSAGSDVAVAANRDLLEGWCSAFAEWAPLERCEGAHTALARALPAGMSGRLPLDAQDGEVGTVDVTQGVVTGVRRMPAAMADGEAGGTAAHTGAGVAPEYVVALGAARADDAGDAGILAPPARRSAMRVRAWRRFATAAIAAIAAMAFATLSLDRWRERTLATLEQEAVRLAEAARPALDAQQRMAAIEAERGVITRALSRRPDPAAALAAISRALPSDVVVLSARATGNEWRLDGTAANASALVPALDRAGQFENVRTVSASSRFRDGARTRETFSLALRVRAAP